MPTVSQSGASIWHSIWWGGHCLVDHISVLQIHFLWGNVGGLGRAAPGNISKSFVKWNEMKWNDQSQSVCIDVLGRMVEPGRILEKVLSRKKYNLFDLHVWKVAPLTGIPSVYWDVQSNGPTDRRPISFTGGSPSQSFENTFYTLDKFFWLFWQIHLAYLTNTDMKEPPTNIIKAGLIIPLRWEISSNFSDSQKSHAEIWKRMIWWHLFIAFLLHIFLGNKWKPCFVKIFLGSKILKGPSVHP